MDLRKFLFNAAIACSFCLFFLFVIEAIARQVPDAVRFKYEWMKQHSSEVETLVLGPSLTYRGIIPELFETKGFNAAFSYQPPKYDWLMMTVDTVNMKNLKNVILLFNPDLPDNNRHSVSYKLYCGWIDHPLERFTTFELSHTKRCKEKIREFFLKTSTYRCRSDGWTPYTGIHDRDYLERASFQFFAYQRTDSPQERENDKIWYQRMFDYCSKHNVRVIAIKTPYYSKYLELGKSSKKSSSDSLVAVYLARYHNMVYRDYSHDSRFEACDFHDPMHLNMNGAEKLTGILKEEFIL